MKKRNKNKSETIREENGIRMHDRMEWKKFSLALLLYHILFFLFRNTAFEGSNFQIYSML